MAATAQDKVGVFALARDGFRLFFANIGRFFTYAFLPGLILAAMNAYLFAGLETAPVDPAASPIFSVSAGKILVFLVSTLLHYLVLSVLSLLAIDLLLGLDHKASQYIGQAVRHLLPIVILSTLYTIAIGVGAALFIVPGLYLAAKYYVFAQATLFENLGWSGLGRASDLSKGYRWPLVGFILVVTIVFILVAGVLVEALAAQIGGGIAFLIDVLVQTIALGLYACLAGVTYLRLRRLTDEMTLEQIARTVS